MTLIRHPLSAGATFPQGEGKHEEMGAFPHHQNYVFLLASTKRGVSSYPCLPLGGRCRPALRREADEGHTPHFRSVPSARKTAIFPTKKRTVPPYSAFSCVDHSAISFTTSYTLQSVLCQAMGDTEMYPARTASMSMVRSQRSYSMGAPTCIYRSLPRYSKASE